MPHPVEVLVVVPLVDAVSFRGDDALYAGIGREGYDLVGVVGLVCEQGTRPYAIYERNCRFAIRSIMGPDTLPLYLSISEVQGIDEPINGCIVSD